MKALTLLITLFLTMQMHAIEVVRVTNSLELIKALGNNKHIIIEGGTYDITLSDTLVNESEYYVKTSSIWESLQIKGLKNVTFEGKDSVSIIVTDPYAWVINFNECSNLTFKNIEFGHKVEGECMGGAALFQNSSNITMKNVGLYGCGTTGLELRKVKNFTLESSRVYKCTYYLTNFSSSENVIIKNTIFENSGIFDMFTFSGNKNVSFDNCTIRNNKQRETFHRPLYFVNIKSAPDNIIFKKCSFSDNKYNHFTNSAGSLILTDCTFSNNLFDEERQKEQKTEQKAKPSGIYFMRVED